MCVCVYINIYIYIYAWFHLQALFKWQNFRNKGQLSSWPKVEEELPGRRWMWYKRATGKTLVALKLLNILTVVLSIQIHTGDKNAKTLTQHTQIQVKPGTSGICPYRNKAFSLKKNMKNKNWVIWVGLVDYTNVNNLTVVCDDFTKHTTCKIKQNTHEISVLFLTTNCMWTYTNFNKSFNNKKKNLPTCSFECMSLIY